MAQRRAFIYAGFGAFVPLFHFFCVLLREKKMKFIKNIFFQYFWHKWHKTLYWQKMDYLEGLI